ncbi:helix-turn-helix transcriptional regulator [Gracilimonas sediminicola]
MANGETRRAPPRIRISTRAVGWLESDIEEWLNTLQASTVDNSEEV